MKDLVYNDLEYLEDCLYYSKEKTLILTDLHIGLGLNYNRLQYSILVEESKRLISKIQKLNKKIERIVILGDVKHNFSYKKDEDFEIGTFFRNLAQIVKEIIVIRGNHDKIGNYSNVSFCDYYEIQDNNKRFLLIHGDKEIENRNDYDLIIFGHEHPKINLLDNKSMRVESYKCFLRGKDFIILPNYNDFSGGNNVLDFNFLNKILSRSDLESSKIIISNPVLELGNLKEVMDVLK